MLLDTNVLWVVVYGVVPIIVVSYVGIGFAPFSAATCALLARRRGFSMKRYALAGGIYSLMFLAPAIYLIVRVAGRRPPTALVVFAYLVLLTLWVAGPLVTPVAYLWVSLQLPDLFGVHRVAVAVTTGIVIVGNAAAMIWWGRWFILQRPAPSLGPLPHVGYVAPFALVPLGLLVFIGMAYVADWIEAITETLVQ